VENHSKFRIKTTSKDPFREIVFKSLPKIAIRYQRGNKKT